MSREKQPSDRVDIQSYSNQVEKGTPDTNKLLKYYLGYFDNSGESSVTDLIKKSTENTKEKIDHELLFETLKTEEKKDEDDSLFSRYLHATASSLINEAFGTRREVLEDNYRKVQESISDSIVADTETKLELAATKIEIRARAKELEAVYSELGRLLVDFEEYRKKNALET
ncbi:MAG: hypothetical protein WCF91_01265 [bacterium]